MKGVPVPDVPPSIVGECIERLMEKDGELNGRMTSSVWLWGLAGPSPSADFRQSRLKDIVSPLFGTLSNCLGPKMLIHAPSVAACSDTRGVRYACTEQGGHCVPRLPEAYLSMIQSDVLLT